MVDAIPTWMVVDTEDDEWDQDDLPGHDFYNKTIRLHFDAGKHEYFRYDGEGNRVEVPGCTTVLHSAIDKSMMLVPWATKLAIDTLKGHLIGADGVVKSFSTEELHQWLHEAKDKHKERLEDAGDIGHTAHDALERTIQYAIDHTNGIVENLLPVDTSSGSEGSKMAQSCFEAGISWIHQHKAKFLHTERKVYSREYDVAGTLDGIALVSSCDDLKCCRGKVFVQRPAIVDWKSSNALRDEYAFQTAFYQFCQLEEFPDEPIYDRFILRLGKLDGKFEPWLIDAKFFEADINTFLDALNLYRSLKSIGERRRDDKAELRAIIKKIKDEAKAQQEAVDREERRLAREASKLATKERVEAAKRHYKSLRAQGLSVDEANSIAYPKTEPTPQQEISPLPVAEPVAVAEEPFELEWSINL